MTDAISFNQKLFVANSAAETARICVQFFMLAQFVSAFEHISAYLPITDKFYRIMRRSIRLSEDSLTMHANLIRPSVARNADRRAMHPSECPAHDTSSTKNAAQNWHFFVKIGTFNLFMPPLGHSSSEYIMFSIQICFVFIRIIL